MKRSRHLKKHYDPPNLILEEVIGLTAKNGNGLASSVSSSKCAYIAGCVVVLFDVDSCTRSHLMVSNRAPKPLSCVALSPDANFVAAGESGHQPAILVWNCVTLSLICELKGHQYGVTCMALQSAGRHLVSVGFPRDGCLCLWDWRNKILVRKVKASSISSPVVSVGFSSDEKFIITAGKNHLKFWNVHWSSRSQSSIRSVPVTMQRKVDIDHCKEWSFVAVASPSRNSGRTGSIQAVDRTPFYAVTERGSLYMVYPGSSISNSVDLEVEKCFALSASNSLVACACNNGVVKLFRSKSLKYTGRLCHGRCQESAAVPHAVACHFSNVEKLVVVYEDHSLYIWDLQDIHKATRSCVLVSHSGCIWDIKNVPCENMHDQPFPFAVKGFSGGLSFATCSADGTIRLWDLVQSAASPNSSSLTANGSSQGVMCLVRAGIFERDFVANYISSPGFRSMAISSDGKHLAAGDFQGNIHVFNLCTSEYKCIVDAHGGEILSLCFNFTDSSDIACTEAVESHQFLASGGQDGKIHLFDVQRNFDLFGSIDYHSSAVTMVKFAQSSHEILSCDADGSLVLHRVDVSGEAPKICHLHRLDNSGTIYDMALDHLMGGAATLGQDKKISVYDIQSGKHVKWFEHGGGAGDPIKVTVDGSCSYLACSYSNSCIRMYDYNTGEMVAQATGHSDVVTGIVFLSDCKHLISVGADGCIFVWKIPALLSSTMLQRNKELSSQFPPENEIQPLSSKCANSCQIVNHQHKDYCEEPSVKSLNQPEEMLFQECHSPGIAGFRFSVSRLPKWAQCKVITESLASDTDSSFSKDNAFPEPQSPSKDILQIGQPSSGNLSRRLSQTDSSKGSQSPPRTCSWELDNRWLTIHTVCMDPLDSPESCGVKRPVTGSRLEVDGQTMEIHHFSKRIKLSSLNPGLNDQSTAPDARDNDVDASRKASQPDKFGNLSAPLKQDSGNAAPSSLRQSTDSPEHNCVNVPESIAGAEMPLNVELVNNRGREANNVNKVEEVEIVLSCEEALHNLEAAAENALRSFSKLATLNIGEEESRDSDVLFYAKAAAKLQSVERKIHSIAKLLKPAGDPA